MTVAIAKAGRPTEVDRERIARVALRLFEQRGFDDVTMDDVARAAKVSRRTLFRHFPSKADLVWSGADDMLGMLRSLAAPAEGTQALTSIVRDLFVPFLMLLDDAETEAFIRRRLRLLARAPSLQRHRMLDDVEALLASLLASRTLPAHASPPLVARTLVAAGFASLLWWAEHAPHGTHARDTLVAALSSIAAATEY